MGRTAGSKNKPKVEDPKPVERVETQDYALTEKGVVNVDVREEETKEVLKPEAPKLEPLAPGQAYFEAPDGTVIIGEDTKNEIWYRSLNDGKGGWINRKR